MGREGKEKRGGKQSDEVKEESRRLHKEEGWRGRRERRGRHYMVRTNSLESFLEVPGHLTFDGVQNISLGDLEKMVPP